MNLREGKRVGLEEKQSEELEEVGKENMEEQNVNDTVSEEKGIGETNNN